MWKYGFWLRCLLLIWKLTCQKAYCTYRSMHYDPPVQQQSFTPLAERQPRYTGNSPSNSFTLCFSDKACIWVRSAVLWDREAQQRSRARASVQERGCGWSVNRSACLFTLRAVPRCFSIEHRVFRNRLSWAAFTHNLIGGDQRNTDILDEKKADISTFVGSTWLDLKLKFYLRCLLIVDATHRNSLMSGSGRHFIELWGFSSVEEDDLAPSICFSFCPRLVNHSTWNRSTMALSSCWSRFLRRIISTDLCKI